MGNRVVQISPGFSHVAYLLEDGTVKVCGNNAYGKLGLGNKDSITTPMIVPGLNGVTQVEASVNNTVFVLEDGSCLACGRGTDGALGIDAYSDEYLIPTKTLIGNVVQSSLTSFSGFYICRDGSVQVCGRNGSGVLGIGVATPQKTPVTSEKLNGVKQITCSMINSESAAFLFDGTVKCCGMVSNNQLGSSIIGAHTELTEIPDLINVKQVEFGGSFSLCLFNDGSVSISGVIALDNSGAYKARFNDFTKINGLGNIKQIACGFNHYACLCNDGSVFTGGCGSEGQLGVGLIDYVSSVKVTNLKDVTAVACGPHDTYFLLVDGTVMGCGLNAGGALGLGDTEQRNTPTVIDALTPTAPEPEPEPEPGVDAKEITVRVHQKTADGYRRIRFEDNSMTLKQLKVAAEENDAIDIALEQPLSAGRNAPEVLVLTEKGASIDLTVEESAAKLDGVVNVNVTGPETLEGGTLYKTDAIDLSVFRSVERIEVG